MPPVPAGQVALFHFRDKVVFTNNTDRALTACVVTIDDAFRADLGAVAPSSTHTIMRSRFRPYVEAEMFYARGSKDNNQIECDTATGRVRVRFEPQVERTVVIPPKE